MQNASLAFIVGFIAMTLIASSYFLPKKSLFLGLQACGLGFLVLSYFFTGEYFAMIGIGVGLARTLTFYRYESKEKNAPTALSYLFSFLTVCAYFIVNLGVLGTAKPLDCIYLVALVVYAFIYRIRDLQTVRLLSLIPTALCVIYNIWNDGVVFVVVSYAFELCANLFSLWKSFSKQKKQIKMQRSKLYE